MSAAVQNHTGSFRIIRTSATWQSLAIGITILWRSQTSGQNLPTAPLLFPWCCAQSVPARGCQHGCSPDLCHHKLWTSATDDALASCGDVYADIGDSGVSRQAECLEASVRGHSRALLLEAVKLPVARSGVICRNILHSCTLETLQKMRVRLSLYSWSSFAYSSASLLTAHSGAY